MQSFGGGPATLTLMRRAAVERYGWLSEMEFTRDWAICQITPGINLLSVTILIGQRAAGWPGSVLALAGLLLPSAAITIAATALYASIQRMAGVQAAFHGIIPATIGLAWFTAYGMARPPLHSASREGRGSLLFSSALFGGSAAVFLIWHPPVLMVLIGAGAAGAVYYGLRASLKARRA